MTSKPCSTPYFFFNIQVRLVLWDKLRLKEAFLEESGHSPLTEIVIIRKLTERYNKLPEMGGRSVPAGHLHLFGLINRVLRFIIDSYTENVRPRSLEEALEYSGFPLDSTGLFQTAFRFVEL